MHRRTTPPVCKGPQKLTLVSLAAWLLMRAYFLKIYKLAYDLIGPL